MKEKRSEDCALGTPSSRGQGAEDRGGVRFAEPEPGTKATGKSCGMRVSGVFL